MLSLVTVSPVITAFHSCCLSHHVFDQVNLWPAWEEIETAIFWQCSPGTVEPQCLYPLCHGPQSAIKVGFFGVINPIIYSLYLKFGLNIVKKKQHQNYQDENKKSTINKKLILRLRSLISKWFQLKTKIILILYDSKQNVLKKFSQFIKGFINAN